MILENSQRNTALINPRGFITMAKLNLHKDKVKPDRFSLKRAQDQDLRNSSSWVRLIEMELDTSVDRGLVSQFFRDFTIYGLREALLYLKGYEEQGLAPRGTFDKLSKTANKIYAGEKE